MLRFLNIYLLFCFLFTSCQAQTPNTKPMEVPTNNEQVAILGAGCFWCVEAAFMDLKGVDSVKSGYTGGHIINPTYKDVCTGNTGHVEVLYIVYDSSIISFDKLLEVFFMVHDPTQLNRQGNDVGTQYRSEIFYTTEEQKTKATQAIAALTAAQVYPYPIVTKISECTTFYPAEDYHDNYFNLNPEQGYCQMVVRPKVEKIKKAFADYMK